MKGRLRTDRNIQSLARIQKHEAFGLFRPNVRGGNFGEYERIRTYRVWLGVVRLFQGRIPA